MLSASGQPQLALLAAWLLQGTIFVFTSGLYHKFKDKEMPKVCTQNTANRLTVDNSTTHQKNVKQTVCTSRRKFNIFNLCKTDKRKKPEFSDFLLAVRLCFFLFLVAAIVSFTIKDGVHGVESVDLPLERHFDIMLAFRICPV